MKIVSILLSVFLIPFAVFAKDGDIEIRGNIEELSSSSITVDSQAITLNSSTEYELANGAHTTLAAFTVGDFVEVKARDENGGLVAREVEFEDESNSGGSSSSSSSSGGHDDDDDDDNSGNNGNHNGDSKREIRAKLRADISDSSNPHGKAKRRTRNEGNNKRRDRFVIKVEIPGDDGSVVRDIQAELSRADIPYAICYLDLDSDDNDDGLQAEYKVDLEQRTKNGNDEFRTRYGECDTDLVTAGVQLDIADAKVGDSVRVYEQLSASQVDLADGSFLKKK